MRRPKCDKCDNLAMSAARDIIEIYSNSPWCEFEYYGERRYGCENHIPRMSRTYRIGDPDYPKVKIA
jgi:hypothetical protein